MVNEIESIPFYVTMQEEFDIEKTLGYLCNMQTAYRIIQTAWNNPVTRGIAIGIFTLLGDILVKNTKNELDDKIWYQAKSKVISGKKT